MAGSSTIPKIRRRSVAGWQQHLCLFLCLITNAGSTIAQPKLMRVLNTGDGLCSNHIYRILEDKRGFLWIATDNGISRYDGLHFMNFSTADGLPENEVLNIELEKNGTLWASCFNGACAWYDTLHNRFVVPALPPGHAAAGNSTGGVFMLVPLSRGGMQYANGAVAYVFLNGRAVWAQTHPRNSPAFLLRNPLDTYTLSYEMNRQNHTYRTACLAYKNAIIDRMPLQPSFDYTRVIEYRDGATGYFLSVARPEVYRLRIITTNPFRLLIDTLRIAHTVTRASAVGHTLIFFAADGFLSVRDRTTLQERYSLATGYQVNTAFEDGHHNLWAGTNDKGLCLYQSPIVARVPMPVSGKDSNLLSLARMEDGSIIAGNYNGQLIAYKRPAQAGNRFIKDLPHETWVRSLIASGGKIFAFTDRHSTANGKPVQSAEGYGNRGGKWATALNDTTLIVANVSDYGGLYTVNTRTAVSTAIRTEAGRVQLVEKSADGCIYYTGLSGLYRYDIALQQATRLLPQYKPLAGRITAMAAAPDSTFWVMTASCGLMLLKGEKAIGTIAPSNGILSSITCLCAGAPGQMFAGTKEGIYSIRYWPDKTGGLRYELSNYSETDGLPDNDVARILVDGDTLYAATGKGLAEIDLRLKPWHFDIVTHLVTARINQREVVLADRYRLKSDENTITLGFAGLEPGGHVRELEYRLDKETAWTAMPGNSVNLLLKSGRHHLEVRAIDRSGRAGKSITTIAIEVDTPLMRTTWFRMSLGAFLIGLVIYAVYRRKLQQTRAAFRQQLRITEERRRITADLHDDIGANLSSLQLYSAVAGKVMDSDAPKAKEMLDKIATQAAAVQDNLGDIIWSMKPADEGLISTTGRIKNFVSEVLGAAGMDYTISLDPALDKVTNITARKNLILIIKEAVNNCVKYSSAAHVSVSAKTEDGFMLMTIADNGIGFDAGANARKGNGITNICRRAEELGGECTYKSRPGEGTTITCRLPVLIFRD